ncbi:MAG: ferrous iron transport protein A [Clostridiales bacterium]|jgi:ferrous iron transport protein A|nr:ferrous iron transport protein A [Clostridiales bacterium]
MDEKVIPLQKIPIGAKAKVKTLLSMGSVRGRLQDIGLIEGTVVECLQKSPAGDPIAYLIRGAVIALRSEESSKILVESCDGYVHV